MAINPNDKLNIVLYKFNKLKNINNDKVMMETYKVIYVINKKINKIFYKLNKLQINFNTSISDKYIIDRLNEIKNYILKINKLVDFLNENKSEINFISELDNHKNVFEYKLASSYLDKYLLRLVKINFIIVNSVLYIDNYFNNIIF